MLMLLWLRSLVLPPRDAPSWLGAGAITSGTSSADGSAGLQWQIAPYAHLKSWNLP